MSLDASLISHVVRHPSSFVQLQQTGITADDFEDEYRQVWRYLTRTRQRRHTVPSKSIVETRFPDIEWTKTRTGDLPILVDQLRDRRKWMSLLDVLDEGALAASSPENVDDALQMLQGKINKLVASGGGDSHLVDLFDKATAIKMMRELKHRRLGGALGMPTGLKSIDEGVGGMVKGRMIVVVGRPGLGKAQPLDAKILTPSGWKTMGDMQVGSSVTCPDGSTAKVIQVHPQGKKDIYRVTFSDGASTEVTADHLWKTQTKNERKRDAWSVKTTKEIASSLKYGSHWNHYVPLIDPVEVQNKSCDLPIDPYVVGALLGDGHVRTRGGATEVLLTSNDAELVDEVNRRVEVGRFTPNKKLCYRFVDGSDRWNKTSTFRQDLCDLGLGSGYAHEKHIPRAYMRASAEDRLLLLQGLLDTDGEASARTSAVYCSTSHRMAKQVREIVWSLGGVATWDERVTDYTNSDGEMQCGRRSYRLRITLPPGVEYFRLARKQDLIVSEGQKKGRAVRTIRSVEKVREAEAQCITIDHPDHLYVTDNYVVTHNSWLDLLFVANAVINGHKWILYPLEMTLEETAFRLYTIFSARMFGAHKAIKNNDLMMGRVTKRKIVRFLHALEDQFAGQLHVADVGSLSDPYTNERIEAEVELHKPDGFWVDYLTLLKAPQQGKGGDDYSAVRYLSSGIKGAAIRQDCVGGCSAQVNREALKVRSFIPRLEHIAYGDSIGQDADQVISLNRRGNYLYYAMVKNRHGPEIPTKRVKFFVDQGEIAETDEQGMEDEEID